jgi:hypothetical protein
LNANNFDAKLHKLVSAKAERDGKKNQKSRGKRKTPTQHM